MKRNKLYTILFSAVFLLLSSTSFAQFTYRPSTTPQPRLSSDTIKLSGGKDMRTLDNKFETEAYRKYVRNETFKYRNKINFRTSIGITQTSFDNWAAGGSNSFSGRAWANLTHTYINDSAGFSVTSIADGAYTMVISDGKTSKSEDNFYISSTPSWKLAPRWEISGSLVFKSQFAKGYTDDTVFTSTFMSPAYLTLSAGITYSPPKGIFTAYLAPISGNATYLLNDYLSEQGGFGVDAGSSHKTEFGAFMRLTYKQTVFKKTTTLESTMESFWNYADTPTLWWESRISYKLNSIFGITLYAKVLYDESVSTPRVDSGDYWQLNQSLGFNLTFNLTSKSNSGPLTFVY